MEPTKPGPGRPRIGQGSAHIDLTLPKEMIAFLRSLPAGQRSKFISELIKPQPAYQDWQRQHEQGS